MKYSFCLLKHYIYTKSQCLFIKKKLYIFILILFCFMFDYKTLENFKRQCFSSMHPYNLAFFK